MNIWDEAVKYLNVKPRSRNQISKYLAGKGYTPEEISDTLNTLEEYGYVNDADFADMYVHYAIEKKHGILKIKRDLKDMGIDSDIIEASLAYTENMPTQEELAVKVISDISEDAKGGSTEHKQKEKMKAKAARRLAGKGFSSEVIYKVIDKEF